MSNDRKADKLTKHPSIPAHKVLQKMPHDMDSASFDTEYGVYIVELVAYCPETDELVRLTCDKEGRLLISPKK